MKRSLLGVVLLGCVLTLNSCNNDDPEPVSPVVGTWSRTAYEFTGLPTGFSYFEGYTVTDWGESGYTFVFNADGTYRRAFVLPSPYNLNDKGKWTLEGTAFKLSPDNPTDLDLIEDIGWPGTEFSVVGEISETRMEISRVVTLGVPSNAAIDAAGGDLDSVPDSEFKPVDVTLVYVFDRLN
jgi:hypothetical protein